MSWVTAYQTKLNKIKVSQNNCIRCIFFANKRESSTPYFTLLEILKLENIFKLKIGALVHKIQYQKKDTPPALYEGPFVTGVPLPSRAFSHARAHLRGVLLDGPRKKERLLVT